MTALSPVAKMQFFDAAGQPLVGGFLYTYAAGTTTPLPTYTDSTGATPNTNPIVLNSRGEANVWLGTANYKFKLTDATDVEIWTVDYISAPTPSFSPSFSGNVVINTDSVNPALTVTQIGTGLALRVQDSADPDVTPFVVASNGYVGIGTTTPGNALDVSGGVVQISSSAGTAYTTLSADAATSTMAAVGARSLAFSTAGVTRLTISSTALTATLPVVLPADPTTALQATTKQYVDALLPAGVIVPFGGSSVPTGWLACNGAVVSQTTYAALYAAIGALWNTGGEGAGNFRLPDLRGAFVRGSGTSLLDPDSPRTVGSFQAEAFKAHTHTATDAGHTHQIDNYTPVALTTTGVTFNVLSGVRQSGTGFANITNSTVGGLETRPDNYAALYIIKA